MYSRPYRWSFDGGEKVLASDLVRTVDQLFQGGAVYLLTDGCYSGKANAVVGRLRSTRMRWHCLASVQEDRSATSQWDFVRLVMEGIKERLPFDQLAELVIGLSAIPRVQKFGQIPQYSVYGD